MSAFQEILDRKTQLESELKILEKQIFELETNYLTNTSQSVQGNIIKGWDLNLLSKPNKIQQQFNQKKPKVNAQDRLFSQSSLSGNLLDENVVHPSQDHTKRSKKKKSQFEYDSLAEDESDFLGEVKNKSVSKKIKSLKKFNKLNSMKMKK